MALSVGVDVGGTKVLALAVDESVGGSATKLVARRHGVRMRSSTPSWV